ncbi:divisome protein SepX/GlpR [Actinacidiphila rubida]|uniref:Uncharacterized protein n=1 Tax=Actinacidiphila rubida TaxID=310780 RepID=A0A1H8DR94_9ACTN|nr:hypothetical protein [Actinacidiphila rubida]SEN09723.1 hypothetical protein SAMN05216267_1001251 [Actinacidiphila rubida]
MSSSGLIYAVIVGAWAAYLVPMWLRRQDELNEARPTERFSTAIRLLSGRAAMERRVAKARAENVEPGTDVHEDDAEDTDLGGAVDVRALAVPATEVKRPVAGRQVQPRPVDPRARVLAARRRTTTLLFLAFTVGAIAAAVGGLTLLWVPAIPAGLLTVYIGQMRRQERRRYEVRLDQHQAAEAARRMRARAQAPAPHAREERPVTQEPAGPPARAQASQPASPAASPRTADRRALVEQTDHAEWVDQQRAEQTADDGWDPVPVPLPTYVTAPVAPRTPGGIDLGAPDTWSSARSGTTPGEPAPSRDHHASGGEGREATREPREQQAPVRRARGSRTPLFDQYADPDRPRAANE